MYSTVPSGRSQLSRPGISQRAGILARQGGIDGDPKLLRVNSVARNEFMLNEVAITQIGQRLEKQSAIVLVVAAFARSVAISLAQRARARLTYTEP
jgi:hypothetical protein